ncbi:MAG: amidohydrolase, partial [Henriciella sp.]
MESFTVTGGDGEEAVTSYALIGPELDPTYFVMDEDNTFFALISPEFLIVRDGYEGNDESLRERAVNYSTERFEALQADYAHTFDAPVRIQNIRIFDPHTLGLTPPASVV